MTPSPESGFSENPEDQKVDLEAQFRAADGIMNRANARLIRDAKPTFAPVLTPEEREGLRVIEADQVPEIMRSCADRAATLFQSAQDAVREHPSDRSFVKKLEQASQFADRIQRAYDAYVQNGGGMSDPQRIEAASKLLTEREKFEELLAPPEPLPGMDAHDLSDAKSMEETMRELEHAAATETETVPDTTDPEDIVHQIKTCLDRIRGLQSHMAEITPAFSLDLLQADQIADEAHERLVRLQRHRDTPRMSPERHDLEIIAARQELRRFEDQILAIEARVSE